MARESAGAWVKRRSAGTGTGNNWLRTTLLESFEAEAPNQRWVGDTTEFIIGGSGKLYLAAIMDLFSRFIVGWAVSAVNDRLLTIKALEMALKRRGPGAGLVHHSDQGCTYGERSAQSTGRDFAVRHEARDPMPIRRQ